MTLSRQADVCAGTWVACWPNLYCGTFSQHVRIPLCEELRVIKRGSAPGPDGLPYSACRSIGGIGTNFLPEANRHFRRGWHNYQKMKTKVGRGLTPDTGELRTGAVVTSRKGLSGVEIGKGICYQWK